MSIDTGIALHDLFPEDVPSLAEQSRSLVIEWDCFGIDSVSIVNAAVLEQLIGRTIYFSGKSKVFRRKDFSVLPFSEKAVGEMLSVFGQSIFGEHPEDLVQL